MIAIPTRASSGGLGMVVFAERRALGAFFRGMKMRSITTFASSIVALTALLSLGCEAEPAGTDAPHVSSDALVSGNGTSLNGTSLNGTSLNGTSLNGTSLNGTSLNGTSLDGTSLAAMSSKGKKLMGADLAGAVLKATASDGSAVTVRIDGVTPSADPEILYYAISWQDGTAWPSICGNDADGAPLPAIPLSGFWDYNAGTPTGGAHVPSTSIVTFACVGSTLAKCVELGYKPWKIVEECLDGKCRSLPLHSFHQACVRMMRADYCGDGASHTKDGVPINLWDGLSIQDRALPGGLWKREAEWSPSGAVCIDALRFDPDHDTADYVAQHCPYRMNASFSCFGSQSTFFAKQGFGKPLGVRSLLRNEFDASYMH
ncbi:ADYC domain-containing protein [Polyangium aurulentum]|uniref:ADYC domain-containing protein n=1 Tax=Polyangium aurulentum TaxID=2567896 RepID=UPI0010AE58EA|nr:ADYC domain-containing protein [Polyangium aurulentum]UQA56655.1 pentapeptide repeat-containing protein [Polyangium aurulentum]